MFSKMKKEDVCHLFRKGVHQVYDLYSTVYSLPLKYLFMACEDEQPQ